MMTLYPWLLPYYQQRIDAFQQGHGHHALLFQAEQGLGTEQLLFALGHWLICQQPQTNNLANNVIIVICFKPKLILISIP